MDYYKLKVLNNKRWVVVVIITLIILIITGYYFFIYRKNNDNKDILTNIDELINDKEEKNIEGDIVVDIKGLVNNPGVYSFSSSSNARINDLINKAGGLMKDADTSTINLSKKLEDEMTVIIYSKNEIANFVKTKDDLNKKLEICENKLKNNACIKNTESINVNNKININEATLEELLKLNGIGETKAKAIIEYREKEKFKSIEEIKNVEGIGDNLFTNIKEDITV